MVQKPWKNEAAGWKRALQYGEILAGVADSGDH
jgi:hypothetical protein